MPTVNSNSARTARKARNAAIANSTKGDEMYQTNGAEIITELNTIPVSLIHAERDAAQLAHARAVQAAKITAKRERDNVSKGLAEASHVARQALMKDIYERQATRTEGLLVLARQAVSDQFGREGADVREGNINAPGSVLLEYILSNAGAPLQSFLTVNKSMGAGHARDFLSHASALPDGHMFTVNAVGDDGKKTTLYFVVFGYKAGSGTAFKATRVNARVYRALKDMSVTEFSLTDRIAKILDAGNSLNAHLACMNNWALSQGAGVITE